MSSELQIDKAVVPAQQVIPAEAGIHVDPRVRGGDGGRVRGNGKGERRSAAAKRAHAMRRLWVEWKKFSPQLDWECSEDEARHRFANEVLRPLPGRPRANGGPVDSRLRGNDGKKPIESWRDLTLGEINRLIREISERSGSAPAYRAMLIATAAAELWGGSPGLTGGWDAVLAERITQRFGVGAVPPCGTAQGGQGQALPLRPDQAHELLEELISRIARRDGIAIIAVRDRLRKGGVA